MADFEVWTSQFTGRTEAIMDIILEFVDGWVESYPGTEQMK
jgi:hypothetical protein